MIIFITIPWFLPAYKAGGPVQSIANLVSNYTENVEYYIFCSNKDLGGEILKNVFCNQWVQYNSSSKVWIWYDSGHQTRLNLVKCTFALKPDVLYTIGLFSLKYNILPLLNCHAKKKILSVRGMLHPGALSQKKSKKKIFLFLFNLIGIKHKIFFHSTDKEEEKFIKYQFGNKVPVFIASNFTKSIIPSLSLEKKEGFLNLICIALISPMKNHLLVLNALAKCTASIKYNIYGPIKDELYWDQCLEQIAIMPDNIIVTYGGEVAPTKVEDLLSNNHVFIMPSKSENFGHSLSEALTAAKPVITSNFTPWNFLAENKAGINIETNIDAIEKAISFFAKMNDDDYKRYVNGAKLYIADKTNIPLLKDQYKKMFSINEIN